MARKSAETLPFHPRGAAYVDCPTLRTPGLRRGGGLLRTAVRLFVAVSRQDEYNPNIWRFGSKVWASLRRAVGWSVARQPAFWFSVLQ